MDGRSNKGMQVIYGAGRIAEFLGIGRRQVYHAAERHGLPVFKIGTTVCARPEAIAAWLSAREASADEARKARSTDWTPGRAGAGPSAADLPFAIR
jgi:excisionase family DNA binding protein